MENRSQDQTDVEKNNCMLPCFSRTKYGCFSIKSLLGSSAILICLLLIKFVAKTYQANQKREIKIPHY